VRVTVLSSPGNSEGYTGGKVKLLRSLRRLRSQVFV
jgi:hypothetical protein